MEQEQRLFTNVIIQAIEDCISDRPVAANASESIQAKLQALAWFRGNSEDYKMICDCAGIDSATLRKKVLTADKQELKELINEYSNLIR